MSYVVSPDSPEALGPRYRERPVELKLAAICEIASNRDPPENERKSSIMLAYLVSGRGHDRCER